MVLETVEFPSSWDFYLETGAVASPDALEIRLAGAAADATRVAPCRSVTTT